MTGLAGRLRTLAALRWSRRIALVEAWLFLGLSRAAVATVGFDRVQPAVGTRRAESSRKITADEHAKAGQIASAISVASRHTPWTSDCLPQAMAAKAMLRRRRVASTLYIGAAFDSAAAASSAGPELVAHAWLRCGPGIVTGGRDSPKRFGAIVSFS